jgi:hypothetical protein
MAAGTAHAVAAVRPPTERLSGLLLLTRPNCGGRHMISSVMTGKGAGRTEDTFPARIARTPPQSPLGNANEEGSTSLADSTTKCNRWLASRTFAAEWFLEICEQNASLTKSAHRPPMQSFATARVVMSHCGVLRGAVRVQRREGQHGRSAIEYRQSSRGENGIRSGAPWGHKLGHRMETRKSGTGYCETLLSAVFRRSYYNLWKSRSREHQFQPGSWELSPEKKSVIR